MKSLLIALLCCNACYGGPGGPGPDGGLDGGPDGGHPPGSCYVTMLSPTTEYHLPARCAVVPGSEGNDLILRASYQSSEGINFLYIYALENAALAAQDGATTVETPTVECGAWSGTIEEKTFPDHRQFRLCVRCADGKTTMSVLAAVDVY